MKTKILIAIGLLLMLNGCTTLDTLKRYLTPRGHQDFINLINTSIGKKAHTIKPSKDKAAGEFMVGEFVINGLGFTHVSKDKNGNVIVHSDVSEILPVAALKGNAFAAPANKEWIGKCLIYSIVDPKTHIIKGWGFDKGGNPLSCRTW